MAWLGLWTMAVDAGVDVPVKMATAVAVAMTMAVAVAVGANQATAVADVPGLDLFLPSTHKNRTPPHSQASKLCGAAACFYLHLWVPASHAP